MATFERRGRRTDVLVIGAGPVGLSLAIGLVLHGLTVRIVDRAPHPKTEPRAAVIWPRGAEVLDDLGVGEPVRAAANELRRLDLHSRGRFLGRVRLGSVDSRYPFPLLIEQDDTERLLAARLAELGTTVEWNSEVVGIRPGPDGVDAALRGPDGAREQVATAWAVACDGARSFVRHSLGIAFEGRPVPDLQILQVDAVPRWRHGSDPGRGFYFIAPDACLGCFPLPDGRRRFFCYGTDPDPTITGPPTLDDMRNLVARVAGTPELRLTDERWLNRARFQERIAERLRHGRVLLAGDAAHVWSSLGGHGMSVGLRGAHNLAWKLAAVHRREAGPVLLDTYEAEQRAAVRAFLRLMKLNVLERPTTPLGFWPREALLRAGLSMPRLAPIVERAVSDLQAGHGSSSLSRGARGARGLAPGARVPDARVLADGREATLHRLLRCDRWTLIVPASTEPQLLASLGRTVSPFAASIAVVSVAVPDDEALRSPARKGLILLVRPDRHIGFVGLLDDPGGLRAYLAAWLRKPAPDEARPVRVADSEPA